MGKKLGHLFKFIRWQFIRWGLLTGAATMVVLGMDALPATADELTDWGYDAQTRSLTLTIPSNISPSVSVLASDQLLIALPDTQIGDVTGLAVGDGVVDSISLEQTTPETLWVIMTFAEGTVLANTQSVVPVGEGAASAAGRQWEVRPVVIASSGVAPDQLVVNGGGADSLRTPTVDVAQADFPDLPILEPRIPLSEPVTVPPLGASPSADFVPPPPPLPPLVEASRPAVSVPDVSEVAESEVAEVEIAPEESVSVEVVSGDRNEAESDEVAASAGIPTEPPFLGEETFEVPVIDETALSEDSSDEVAESIVEAAEPVAVATPEEPVPTMESDEIPAAEVAAAEREPTVEADVVPGDTVASVPSLQTQVDASFAVEPEPAAEAVEPAAEAVEPAPIDFAAQGVTPQNTTGRWPDPIPFGVPLPR